MLTHTCVIYGCVKMPLRASIFTYCIIYGRKYCCASVFGDKRFGEVLEMTKFKSIFGSFAVSVLLASVFLFSGGADRAEGELIYSKNERTEVGSSVVKITSEESEDYAPEYYGRAALATLPNSGALLFAYDALASGIEISQEKISVYDGKNPISQSEMQMVFDAYRRDRTEHFWLGNSYTMSTSELTVHSVTPKYIFEGAALAAARAEFDSAVEEYLKLVEGVESEFERELILHDALAQNLTYVTGAENAHNAYGAIVQGRTVCEGYAEAFQYLLMRSGIQSFIINGSSINPSTGTAEGHAWNAVKIDGKFYHVDLTWNDQESGTFHAYFNQPTSVIEADHAIDSAVYPLPVCNYSDANYFNVKGGAVTEPDAAELASLLKNGDFSAHVYIEGDTQVFIQWYYDNISAIASEAGLGGGFTYGYSKLGKELLLVLSPSACFRGVSLAVDSSCTLFYYVNVLDKTVLDEGRLAVRFTFGGAVSVVYDYVLSDGLYAFSFTEIPLHKMRDEIKAELILVYENNSYIRLGQKDSYSVEEYFAELLEAHKDSPELEALVNDMFILGTEAQKALSYNTEALPDGGINPEPSAHEPKPEEAAQIIGGENSACKITDVSVLYDGEPHVFVDFYAESLDFTLSVDGENVSRVMIKYLGRNMYRYVLPKEALLGFNSVHIIELESAGELVSKADCSVYSAVARTVNSETASEEACGLLFALYRAGKSAEAYALVTEKAA